jgi:hypothetical protein
MHVVGRHKLTVIKKLEFLKNLELKNDFGIMLEALKDEVNT